MIRPSRRARVVSVIAGMMLVGAAAPAALAQLAPDRPGLNQPSGALPPRFVKIEQMIADVDPLRVSTRNLATDLRQPTDFHDVFQIRGSSHDAAHWGVANPTGGDLFARVHGAVTAVFPQSVYVNSRNGVLPLIPPGTVFFIGQLPYEQFGARYPVVAPDRVDSRLDLRLGAPGSVPPPPPRPHGEGDLLPTVPTIREAPAASQQDGDIERTDEPIAVSMMTDEAARRSTVRELIMKAVRQATPRPTEPAEPAPAEPAKPKTDAPAEPEKKTAPEKPERP